ncbi:hypothetical protein BDB01DRAFT_847225 [Pilobolus umbonatus]|nr:hypothetical protein BDB01DRAFT_847225 [Pilobolus umbonatus]
MEPTYKRDCYRSSCTDDEDQVSRMSDIDCDKDFYRGRRCSSSSLPASPSSSYKMSVDSDDGRSMSSISVGRSHSTNRPFEASILPENTRPTSKPAALHVIAHTNTTITNNNISRSNSSVNSIESNNNSSSNNENNICSNNNHIRKVIDNDWTDQTVFPDNSCNLDEVMSCTSEENDKPKKETSIPTRSDPERRIVSRRSGSLLPKSKALLRVMDQAEEDTHLADIEMRREQSTTLHLKLSEGSKDVESVKPSSQSVPIAAWTKVSDYSPSMAYQCSKLNPELEMTNFQLENLPSPIQQSFRNKRKASDDYSDSYSSSIKRRAVSPSVSLTGSPVLTALSSPPTCFAPHGSGSTSNNAAARANQKLSQLTSSSFNLHDASGGLSRMSLSE